MPGLRHSAEGRGRLRERECGVRERRKLAGLQSLDHLARQFADAGGALAEHPVEIHTEERQGAFEQAETDRRIIQQVALADFDKASAGIAGWRVRGKWPRPGASSG